MAIIRGTHVGIRGRGIQDSNPKSPNPESRPPKCNMRTQCAVAVSRRLFVVLVAIVGAVFVARAPTCTDCRS